MGSEEQRVKRNGFGQGHADDGLNEDFTGSAGVAANGLNGLCADKTYAESGAQTAERALNAAGQFCDNSVHDDISSWWDFRRAHALARSRRENLGVSGDRFVSMGVRFAFVGFVAVIAHQSDVNTDEQREDERLYEADKDF